MDPIFLLFAVAIGLLICLFLNAVMNADNMQHLGLILIAFSLLFGNSLVFVAGVCLFVLHHMKRVQ